MVTIGHAHSNGGKGSRTLKLRVELVYTSGTIDHPISRHTEDSRGKTVWSKRVHMLDTLFDRFPSVEAFRVKEDLHCSVTLPDSPKTRSTIC